jgi:gamma-glutamyltranspeptidase/glutathione hydrolase
LTNIIDKEESLDAAVKSPRLHCSMGGTVSIEARRFKPEIISYLEEMGYSVEKKSDYDFYFGAIHSVMRCMSRDEFQGAAEIRRDGIAAGI